MSSRSSRHWIKFLQHGDLRFFLAYKQSKTLRANENNKILGFGRRCKLYDNSPGKTVYSFSGISFKLIVTGCWNTWSKHYCRLVMWFPSGDYVLVNLLNGRKVFISIDKSFTVLYKCFDISEYMYGHEDWSANDVVFRYCVGPIEGKSKYFVKKWLLWNLTLMFLQITWQHIIVFTWLYTWRYICKNIACTRKLL